MSRHAQQVGTATELPSPMLLAMNRSRASKETLISSLMEKLDISSNYGPQHGFDLRNALERFNESTLVLIQNAVAVETFYRPKYMHDFLTEKSESIVREVMCFKPQFRESIHPVEAKETILGLHRLERYKDQVHLDVLSGTELDIATAFLNITKELHEHTNALQLTYHDWPEEDENEGPHGDYRDETLRYISDIALQGLIAEHYRQADAIISYIRGRHSADPKALREYLTNGTALNEGVL